ncbi:hypothetical protein MPSEU_000933300 [Mayamaea pseudoterrestris]|nr:hypothetical protein MPSEU_000933300 [Mayamaea pseudoterrestris]
MMPQYPQEERRSVLPTQPLRPVTPNENEMSAFDSSGSLSELTPKMHRSESIPIASNKLKRSPSEVQLYEEEAMADYRDYAMFQRIVDGIQKTQSQTRDCRWRHANDVSLQHVYKARHEENRGEMNKAMNKWGLADKLPAFNQTSLVGLMSQVYPDDDAMPFTLEM